MSSIKYVEIESSGILKPGQLVAVTSIINKNEIFELALIQKPYNMMRMANILVIKSNTVVFNYPYSLLRIPVPE